MGYGDKFLCPKYFFIVFIVFYALASFAIALTIHQRSALTSHSVSIANSGFSLPNHH